QGYRPHLYQIKSEGYKETQKDIAINKACKGYAKRRNWNYSIVKPKEGISQVIISNVLLLTNYLKPRKNYEKYIPEILYKMKYLINISVIELAKSFSSKVDFRFVLPVVYHLIATGRLNTDLNQPIDHNSVVQLGNIL